MQTNTSIKDGQAVVLLSGRFDFNAHRDFRSAYEPLMDNAEARTITIDLRNVEYMDSSALGMLLMLRDKTATAKKDLFLANAQAGVKQVLDIANFGKLFKFL
jgi:anti-anti-sigma factor